MVQHEKPGLAARRAAMGLVQGVTLDQLPLDHLLETSPEFNALEGRDRSFAHALAATTLRHGGEIGAVLSKFLSKPLPKSSGMAVDVLTLGTCQLLFMDVSPHAAIDLAVALAKQDRKAQHFSGLINAVLRKVASEGKQARERVDAPRLNTPDWLWQQWVQTYGEITAREMAIAHAAEAPLDITVKSHASRWAQELRAELLPTGSVRLEGLEGSLSDLPGFADGEWWVQDAASALPARLLGNVSRKSILDLCAAPGGKTAQLAAAGAHVTAVDDSVSRLNRLRGNLRRLGLPATIVQADVLSLDTDILYDGILLDAPCSATGTIRRHPDVIYLKTPHQLNALVALQEKMLSHAANLLKPGGYLVFCTCSLSPLEGERQIFKFLRSRQDFTLQPINADEVGGEKQLVNAAGLLRCLPHMTIGKQQGLDGFFAARLQRNS